MKKTWSISAILFLVVFSTGLVVANKRADGDDPSILAIVASPQTVVLGEKSVFVTIHSNIPVSSVENVSLTLIQDGVTIDVTKISTGADDLGDLVVRFNLNDTNIAVGTVTLTLTGTYKVGGDDFKASADIIVKAYAKK